MSRVKSLEDLQQYRTKPLEFVMDAFTWGEGELWGRDGPFPWQRKILQRIGDRIDQGACAREAVASGHNTGCSALASWVTLWAVASWPESQGLVTASTEFQLFKNTWTETRRWAALSWAISKKFEFIDGAYTKKICGENKSSVDFIPWSSQGLDRFAGHMIERSFFAVFDGASGIPESIWSITDAAFVGSEGIVWLATGQPLRNVGAFKECFDESSGWMTNTIDARLVPTTNKRQIAEWAKSYGEESPFFRARVRGEFTPG